MATKTKDKEVAATATVPTPAVVTEAVETPAKPTPIPERDGRGLLKGVEYIFDDLGFVHWRAMIPKEFLVLNSDQKDRIEKKYNKTLSEIDINKDEIDDSDLIILLGGLKYLARLRGIRYLDYNVIRAEPEFAAVNCTLAFIDNFESAAGQPTSFQDNANASPLNTKGFGRSYPLEIATNRAFSRCIRNALNINIVSKEELGAAYAASDSGSDEIPPSHPANALQTFLAVKGVSYDTLKAKLVAKVDDKGAAVFPDAEKWVKVMDIPKKEIFRILSLLKEKNGE
jgi:hypothetical protein